MDELTSREELELLRRKQVGTLQGAVAMESPVCEHGLPMTACGLAHHMFFLTARYRKCLDGEHDADWAMPILPLPSQNGHECRPMVCRWCRCLFVEK